MVATVQNALQARWFRFLVAGGTAFVIEYCSFLVLYYAAGLAAAISNTVGFLLGFATSFTLNKLWVFKGGQNERHISHQLLMYGAVALVNVVITGVVITWLVRAGVPAFIAKVLLMIAVAVWNFFIFKHLIFKTRDSR